MNDYELENKLFELANKSNTINDFYPDTISMLQDLLNLYDTKILDNLKEGQPITKGRLMEIMGFAHHYVVGFAEGWQPDKEK